MSVVVSVRNFLHPTRLTHRLFQAFLKQVSVNYSVFLYHAEVLWLSNGRVLQPSVEVRDKTVHSWKIIQEHTQSCMTRSGTIICICFVMLHVT
jgi:hypothetical protein